MTERSTTRRSLRLSDLAALVVGFGLAALLVRAFWHSDETPSAQVAVVLSLVYLWLGLAMSGPVVLLLDRRAVPKRLVPTRVRIGQEPGGKRSAAAGQPAEAAETPSEASSSNPRYTRAELAWLSIGAYWIGMTLLVVPARLNDTPLALVAVFQMIVALALWVFGPRTQVPEGHTSAWTHQLAIAVLVSWPVAWVALVLLSLSVI
jgi:hypothetical protein